MRITESVDNEEMLERLHGELMSVVRQRLDRAVEPVPTLLADALGDALGHVLSTHGRERESLPFLRAYMHELACEAGRYDQRIHAPSLGTELTAVLEARLSQSAIAA